MNPLKRAEMRVRLIEIALGRGCSIEDPAGLRAAVDEMERIVDGVPAGVTVEPKKVAGGR